MNQGGNDGYAPNDKTKTDDTKRKRKLLTFKEFLAINDPIRIRKRAANRQPNADLDALPADMAPWARFVDAFVTRHISAYGTLRTFCSPSPISACDPWQTWLKCTGLEIEWPGTCAIQQTFVYLGPVGIPCCKAICGASWGY